MSKIRVHELAKELNKSSKDVIYALKGHGVVVESHMSTISDESAGKIRKFFTAPPVKKEEAPKAAAPERQPVRPQSSAGTEQRPAGNSAPQNRQGQSQGQNGERRPYNNNYQGQNRQGQGQGQNGERRPYNNNYQGQNRQGQGQGQNGERRPYNNNNNYQGQGQNGERRPYNNNYQGQNRQGQGQNGERRPYNNNYQGQNRQGQGQGQNGERRPYNNNYQGQNRQGQGQGQNGERRPYNNNYQGQNRQGQGQNGSRPYNSNYQGQNRQGQGQGQGRPYNNNGGQNRPGQGGYNNNRGGGYNNNRGGGGYNNNRGDGKFNLDSAITKEVVATKDTTRENRRNYKDKEKPVKTVTDGRNVKKGFGGRPLARKGALHPPVPKPKPVVEKVTNIILPEIVTIKELGDKMKISGAEIVKKLFLAGKMVTLNTEITYDEAEEIALEYEVLCEHEIVIDPVEEILKEEEEENEADLQPRPPVVCVMGHVDHGKTSILDAIRDTHVTTGEAGGITQHIGAYVVDVKGQKITFLDTPGHEAFTAMRLRGAQSTDIAILVVAADDGVMPQTIEAISHAKAAGIEVIVAINKIDKPSANIERVKQELTEYELVPEDWGGTTLLVPVSAHTGEGLDDLLDAIVLQAEICELKANPNRNARGLVIEAQLDKGRGPVATVLVQKGTLHVGDSLAIGAAFGKVRAMIDDKGRRIKEAGPSIPVEILGLNDVPEAGEVFIATDTEKEARVISETFVTQKRERLLADTKAKLSLDGLFDQIQAGQIKELNIIVKADVQGSVEAVKQSLMKLSNEEVAIKIIHGGVGAINESDVTLASTSNAIIIGFNVRPDNMAKTVADSEKVDMRLYRVIYNAIEDIEAAMKGMLDPEFREKVIGHAEVRQTYKVSGVGTIIGGYVLDGKIERNSKVRLLRDDVVIHEGELASLKRFKDDVKEVATGYECGMSLEKFNDVKEGDQLEVFIMEEIPR